jgi:hypothetical protein
MSDSKLLEDSAKERQVMDEFNEKYCKRCGTQMCMGVYDKEWREGCIIWKETQKSGKPLTGVEIIKNERINQIKNGWTLKHDAEHKTDDLAFAGATYALPKDTRDMLQHLIPECEMDSVPPTWPWDPEYWHPTPEDRIKELAKAGALIAAEIDRLNNLKDDTIYTDQ